MTTLKTLPWHWLSPQSSAFACYAMYKLKNVCTLCPFYAYSFSCVLPMFSRCICLFAVFPRLKMRHLPRWPKASMHAIGACCWGESRRGGCPPSLRGVWGVSPQKNFEILHAIWWHLVTSEAISWSCKGKCFLRIVCCQDGIHNIW